MTEAERRDEWNKVMEILERNLDPGEENNSLISWKSKDENAAITAAREEIAGLPDKSLKQNFCYRIGQGATSLMNRIMKVKERASWSQLEDLRTRALKEYHLAKRTKPAASSTMKPVTERLFGWMKGKAETTSFCFRRKVLAPLFRPETDGGCKPDGERPDYKP